MASCIEILLLRPKQLHSILLLTVLLIVCCLAAEDSASENAKNEDADIDTILPEVGEMARTFGHHFMKRMSFAVIPGAFVVGVITTLLGALTVVSLKGLGVGIILLVLAIGQMLSRTLPHVHAAPAAFAAPPPLPVVYSHSHTQQPVWFEKDW